jgi:hypothetical protein
MTTGLWRSSLGLVPPSEADKPSVERLRNAYLKLREHAKVLTEHIRQSVPSLTVHDITHLDALWELADLIAGPDYPVNPLEGFVLGGAILLHDSALCFEAYEGGQDGLRNSTIWKDAYASISRDREDRSADEINRLADFAALRSLHAARGSELGTAYWETPGKERLYLIDDADLRAFYGSLIGEIASTHHWTIERVEGDLRKQIGSSSEFPREWRVDPVKIACLLRCADAAHLDDRRAPLFLWALTKPSDDSLDHWAAQNWLARAEIDQSAPERNRLLFTSQRNFRREDAGAWWVAYDAIEVVDKEIKASNAVLKAGNRSEAPPFKVEGVTAAGHPGAL